MEKEEMKNGAQPCMAANGTEESVMEECETEERETEEREDVMELGAKKREWAKVPGMEFEEEVIRQARNMKGQEMPIQEMVKVTQIYNMYGQKIRKQCSSCKKYMTVPAGLDKPVYCPNAIVHLSRNTEYVNGRGICDEWAMADCFRTLGTRGTGKCKSVQFIMWSRQNNDSLHREYQQMLDLWGEAKMAFATWRRQKYETATGYDCFGKKIEKEAAV